MQEKDAQQLLDKYKTGNCTEEELVRLRNWFNTIHISDDTGLSMSEMEEISNEIWSKIQVQKENAPIRRLWPRIAAAASIILVLSTAGYFMLHKKQPLQQIAQNQQHDIAPGRNQATLTLANGRKIILQPGLKGKLAIQGNTLVQVNSGNAVAYSSSGANANLPVEYNTLSTTRGEKSPYPLILSDGTKIWLNAASSVTFPTTFNGDYRKIKITGEADMEVGHNARQPFFVNTRGQTIQDIGTHFNINAYADEPVVRTTLLEGSARVTNGTASVVLKPGQQAISPPNQNTIKTITVDAEEIIGWKEGKAHFDRADVKQVLRSIARWYDVEVVYETDISKREFSGDIPLNLTASQALQVLEITHIASRIEGRKIIVRSK